jgi:hypothetical protein
MIVEISPDQCEMIIKALFPLYTKSYQEIGIQAWQRDEFILIQHILTSCEKQGHGEVSLNLFVI